MAESFCGAVTESVGEGVMKRQMRDLTAAAVVIGVRWRGDGEERSGSFGLRLVVASMKAEDSFFLSALLFLSLASLSKSVGSSVFCLCVRNGFVEEFVR